MKRMKKICSMLLCVSLAFALAACGSSTQEETSASADAEEVTFAAYTNEAAEVYAGTALVFTDDLEADESGDAAVEESGDVSEDASGDASDEECVVSSCTCSDMAVAFTYEVLVSDGAMTEIVSVEKAVSDADAESGDAEDAESGDASDDVSEDAAEEVSEDASGDAASYYTEVILTDEDENETAGYLFSETGEYLVTIAVTDAEGIDGELVISLTVSDNTYVENYGEGLALSGVMALSGSAYAEEILAEKYETALSAVKEYCSSIEDADELLETVTGSGVVDAYNSAAEALGSDSITEGEFITEAQAQIEEEEDDSESESSSGSAENTSSSSGSSSSGSSSSSSSSSSHTHTWVAVTEEVYHEEEGHYETVVVQEEVKEKRYICKGCGASFTADEAMKCVSHTIYCNGGSSYTTGWVVVQEEVTEQQWVVDTAAYTETVTTGYKCSTCGATK